MAALTRIPVSTLLRCCARSFLLQASWNFERMQNLGFLYQILPGLRRLHGKDPSAEILERHAAYFNTHPFLAPWVAGAVLSLEARQLAGESLPVDGSSFRQMVMAPYAAMGDAFFWGAVRPLAAVVSLFLAVEGFLWAPLMLLLLFNLPHLLFRGAGLLTSYGRELQSVELLQRLRLPDLAIWIKEGTVILLGVLCAFMADRGCAHQEIESGWGLILLPVVLLFSWLTRRGVTSFFLILITTASLLGLALIF